MEYITLLQRGFPQGTVLVTSSQTAFDIDYLVELAARVQISSLTFEGFFYVNHMSSMHTAHNSMSLICLENVLLIFNKP